MKKILLAMVGAGLLTGAVSANAGPEEDRMKLVNYFTQKYPDIKLGQYVYGALAFDPDAKSQYDTIMESPSYIGELAKAAKLFKIPFKNGKTYTDCLPNGGRMIAGNYPMFDDATGKVVTLEDAVNNCRVANGEEAYKMEDDKTMGLLMAHIRGLSDGMKMNIQVNGPGAMKAFEDGKHTYYQRVGQFNFSCASCHVEGAGNRLRSELLSPGVGQAVHWPVFRGGEQLVSLQGRYSGCFKNMRQVSDKQGSERFNNLEYFHSYLSNGLEMKASVFRK
jgi:sulfur-oxidizing protein SoxA